MTKVDENMVPDFRQETNGFQQFPLDIYTPCIFPRALIFDTVFKTVKRKC